MMNGATPKRLGVDAEHDVGHGRVAGEGDLVDLRRAHAALLADGLRQLVERLVGEPGQPLERPVVHHDRADARDHVGAEAAAAG